MEILFDTANLDAIETLSDVYPVAFEHERIGQMAAGLEHGLRRADRALWPHLHRRNDAFRRRIGEFFHEDELAAPPGHDHRVGVESLAIVGQHVPAALRKLHRFGQAIRACAPPADIPVRGPAQQLGQEVPRGMGQRREGAAGGPGRGVAQRQRLIARHIAAPRRHVGGPRQNGDEPRIQIVEGAPQIVQMLNRRPGHQRKAGRIAVADPDGGNAS